MPVRLHVNLDHVATLREARGTDYPDPVDAAVLAELAGADGITVHLREDRRHIQDRDVEVLRRTVKTLLNIEMAATDEMVEVAVRIKPDLVTLVPERRQERTTEGGLDVAARLPAVRRVCERLGAACVPVSIFVDPREGQVAAAAESGASMIELHTGDYAGARCANDGARYLTELAKATAHSRRVAPALRVAAGHGLTVRNVGALIANVSEIEELNIGHAVVADAVLLGMERAVARFRAAIATGESQRPRDESWQPGLSR